MHKCATYTSSDTLLTLVTAARSGKFCGKLTLFINEIGIKPFIHH